MDQRFLELVDLLGLVDDIGERGLGDSASWLYSSAMITSLWPVSTSTSLTDMERSRRIATERMCWRER